MIGSLLQAPATHASHNFFTVTGGNPLSLPEVGAAAIALPTLTVQESSIGFSEDFADNEVVRIAINTTNYGSVVFDSSVLAEDLTIAGTCGYTVATDIAYSSSDQIADITLDDTVGNDGCGDLETFTIAGLQIETLYSQDAPGAAALISVDSFSLPGLPNNTSDIINLSVSAADANATITLDGNEVVGEDGTLTLELTVPFELRENNSIGMTFSESVDVTGVSPLDDVGGTFENGGEIICNPDLPQRIYCEVAAGTTTLITGTLIITGVTTRYADTADVDLGVEQTFTSTRYIAIDQTTEMTDITATDANATVTLGTNSVVGQAGNTTVTFTLPIDLADTDTVDITFPAHLNVAGVAFGSETFAGAGTFGSCTAAGQVVTCTANGDITAGTGNLVLTGITSTAAGTNDVTALEVEYEGVAANDIAIDTTITTTDSTAAEEEGEEEEQQNNSGGGGGYTGQTYCLLFKTNCPESESEEDSSEESSSKTSVPSEETAPESSGSEAAPTKIPFTDIEGHWAQVIIEKAYLNGVISGKTTTLFEPDGGIARGETAKILINLSGVSKAKSVSNSSFIDISNHWAALFVETLRVKGWSEGYKATNEYKPDQFITRGEFTKLALEVYGYDSATGESPFSDTAGKWYEGYAIKAYNLGAIKGEGSIFGGDESITRAEALAIMDRLAKVK